MKFVLSSKLNLRWDSEIWVSENGHGIQKFYEELNLFGYSTKTIISCPKYADATYFGKKSYPSFNVPPLKLLHIYCRLDFNFSAEL